MRLTLNKVKSTAAKIVKNDPDYVYGDHHGSCVYGPSGDDNKRCLVGQILFDLGAPIDSHGSASFGSLLGCSDPYCDLDFIADNGLPVIIDPKAADYLDTLQQYQDGGDTWGTAFRLTNKVL